MCGEKGSFFSPSAGRAGSPPRVRGKAGFRLIFAKGFGITPACAGKRASSLRFLCPLSDHPRVCGEKLCQWAPITSRGGSPPRVRGKVPLNCCGYPSSRITPACAGKSPSEHTSKSGMRDHPRVCGEKTLLDNRRFLHRGSPPRVRGKAVLGSFLQMVLGITPACAGKSWIFRP